MINIIGAIWVVVCIILFVALWVRMCYQVLKVIKEDNERNEKK